MEAQERNPRKTRIGVVVGDKMQKSVVVACERHVSDPVYKKTVKQTLRLMAHDEKGEAHVGDKVVLMETRPISKRKRWRVVEILEKAK